MAVTVATVALAVAAKAVSVAVTVATVTLAVAAKAVTKAVTKAVALVAAIALVPAAALLDLMVDNLGSWLVVNVLVDNLRRSLVVDDDWLRLVVNNGRWDDVHNLWLNDLLDDRLMVVRGIDVDDVLVALVVFVAVDEVTVAVSVAGIDDTNVLLALLAVAVAVSVVTIDDDNVLAVAVAVTVTVADTVATVATIATVAMTVAVSSINDNDVGLVVMMMSSLA